MSLNFEVKGLKELQEKIAKMRNNTEQLSKTKSIPLNDLLTNSFISYNTKFKSFEDMMNIGNFDISSAEAFENIPDNELDNFIANNSKFKSWQEMLNTAFSEYVQQKLFG